MAFVRLERTEEDHLLYRDFFIDNLLVCIHLIIEMMAGANRVCALHRAAWTCSEHPHQ